LEEVKHQYLFGDESGYTFMDPNTYEQIILDKDIVGEKAVFLQDGM